MKEYNPTFEKDTTSGLSMKKRWNKYRRSIEIIMVEDMNGRVGKEINNKSRFVEYTVNNNGERLRINRDIHKYTFIQETGRLKSITDYFVIKKESSMIDR